jgi:hypothetical protein
MSALRTSLAGGCHCGNIRILFESDHSPEKLPLRACTCSFCRAHGGISTSDPLGRLQITVRDPALLSRYRFGFKTADFLICRSCGVYVAAVQTEGEACFATLNVNVLDVREVFRQTAVAADYDGEQAVARRARRAATWTPTKLHLSPG